MKINIQKLKREMAADDEFICSMMETILEEVPQIISGLKNASAREDWTVVRLTAHKLLGTARIIDDRDLIDLLYKIENDADAREELAAIPNLINRVNKICQEIMDEITGLLKRMNTQSAI